MQAINLQDVGKRYILRFEKGAIIKDIIPRLFRPKKVKLEFWALRNIDLTIKQGESIGLIGPNACGKTTLLSLISKIAYPTEGKIKVNGKLSTLLTLGAGFHMELTGMDNILLNGIILGMKLEEIKKKLQEIIAFSELHEFINQPFYTYSAGMMLRLGFSVAAFVDFDILLIDEIISVGDIYFQRKCFSKINEFKKMGKTLIIASQSMEEISSLCDRVIFLEKGKIKAEGNSDKVISCYQSAMTKNKKKLIKLDSYKYSLDRGMPLEGEKIKIGWGTRIGTKDVTILEVKQLTQDNKVQNIFHSNKDLQIKVVYKVNKIIENPHFGIAIFRDDFLYCYGPNTKFDNIKIRRLQKGIGEFGVVYKNLPLADGTYKISAVIWEDEERYAYDYYYAFYELTVQNKEKIDGLLKVANYWLLDSKKKIVGETVDDKMKTWIKNQKEFLPLDNPGKSINCKLTDIKSKARYLFITGEVFKADVETAILNPGKDIQLFAFIYREDGILCHQSGLRITEDCILDNKSIFKASLVYPVLPLMDGSYYFLAGIWNNNSLAPLAYTLKDFIVYSNKKDHGIVYIGHNWIIKLPED